MGKHILYFIATCWAPLHQFDQCDILSVNNGIMMPNIYSIWWLFAVSEVILYRLVYYCNGILVADDDISGHLLLP